MSRAMTEYEPYIPSLSKLFTPELRSLKCLKRNRSQNVSQFVHRSEKIVKNRSMLIAKWFLNVHKYYIPMYTRTSASSPMELKNTVLV